MKRRSEIVPGYDCRVTCTHERKGDHGVHNETWYFVVSEDDMALELSVGTGIYPPSVTHIQDKAMHSYGLVLHVGFPHEREHLLLDARSRECENVPSGRCWGDHWWGARGSEFFKEHFVISAGFDQPESFWRALEDDFRREAKRFQRIDTKYERCSHCDGTGTVRKP